MRPLFAALVPCMIALVAGGATAQTPEQTPPAQAAPAAPPQPAPQAQPPRPFPEGAKVAYVNFQRIASESKEGVASTAKVKALNDQKLVELQDKQKLLQESQNKLQQSGSVLSDQARVQLERDIERMQIDLQRASQDAQAEVQALQEELQIEFQRKLLPLIGEVAAQKGLHFVFSQLDSGIVWADQGLDITTDVIQRFDAQSGAGAQDDEPGR